jgi:hypothetical protein
VSAALPQTTTQTAPRVAVVSLPAGPLGEAERERLLAASRSAVCGVVLDVQPGPLTEGHAGAAAEAAEILRAADLDAIVVARGDAERELLRTAGFAGRTAETLTAALTLAVGPRAHDAKPSRPPALRPVDAGRVVAGAALQDDVLRAVAGLGLRFRTGAVLAARAAGLTLVEYLVISELALRGVVGSDALARGLALPEDELQAVLERLRGLRLVTHAEVPKRAYALTPLGRELLLAPAGELAGDLQDAVSGLDDPERESLATILGDWSAAQERHNERLRAWIAGAR